MDAFVRRRKEKVKGRSRIDEVMVWESLRLKMENNSDEIGNPAAWNRDQRRELMVLWRGME